MQKKVTAVFDIGKTNKKFFLFDKNFKEVYREYSRFDEIKDEDGYPTEDLDSLQKWLKEVFDRILKDEEYNITGINFSTYGASLVHLDENLMDEIDPSYKEGYSIDFSFLRLIWYTAKSLYISFTLFSPLGGKRAYGKSITGNCSCRSNSYILYNVN